MAQAEVGYLEAAQGDLPAICLCCGRPAEFFKPRKLSTLPFGMPFLLIPGAIIYGGKISIQAPLCRAHRNYFLKRMLLRGFGWLPILVFLMLIPKKHTPGQTQALAGWGVVGAALAYGILILVLHYRGLRIVKHNRERMVVAGLSAPFAEAIEAKHGSQNQILKRLAEPGSASAAPSLGSGLSASTGIDVSFASAPGRAPAPADEAQGIR